MLKDEREAKAKRKAALTAAAATVGSMALPVAAGAYLIRHPEANQSLRRLVKRVTGTAEKEVAHAPSATPAAAENLQKAASAAPSKSRPVEELIPIAKENSKKKGLGNLRPEQARNLKRERRNQKVGSLKNPGATLPEGHPGHNPIAAQVNHK